MQKNICRVPCRYNSNNTYMEDTLQSTYSYLIMKSLKQSFEAGIITTPILQVRKLKHRKIKEFVQDYCKFCFKFISL